MIFLICRRIWERMDNLPIIFLLSVVLVGLVSGTVTTFSDDQIHYNL